MRGRSEDYKTTSEDDYKKYRRIKCYAQRVSADRKNIRYDPLCIRKH